MLAGDELLTFQSSQKARKKARSEMRLSTEIELIFYARDLDTRNRKGEITLQPYNDHEHFSLFLSRRSFAFAGARNARKLCGFIIHKHKGRALVKRQRTKFTGTEVDRAEKLSGRASRRGEDLEMTSCPTYKRHSHPSEWQWTWIIEAA